MRYLLTFCLLCLLSVIASAKPVPKRDVDGPAVAEQGTIVPDSVPLKVRLIASETVFRLNRGGLSEEGYVQLLQQARKTGELPAPPRVDVIFDLENTSDKEVQLVVGGDVSG